MAFVPTGSFAQSTSTPPSCVQGSEFYDAARCAADRLRAGTVPSLINSNPFSQPPLSQQVRLYEGGGQQGGGQQGGDTTGGGQQGGDTTGGGQQGGDTTGGGQQGGDTTGGGTTTGGSSAGSSGGGSALALLALGGLGLLFLLSRDGEGERGAAREVATQGGKNFFLVGKREEEDKRKRRSRGR
jgi:hypothetical protein